MTRPAANAGTSTAATRNLTVARERAKDSTVEFSSYGPKNGVVTAERLVDASVMAGLLGVSRAFVYEHSEELGAVRLGAGPRARLRFSPDRALERLTACSGSRGSSTPQAPQPSASRRRTSRATLPAAQLLPIARPIVNREAA